MEWNDLTLRAGLRFEYFDARSTVPERSREPGQLDRRAPRTPSRWTPRSRQALSPRLGVAVPDHRPTRRSTSPTATSTRCPALGHDLHERRLLACCDDLQAGGDQLRRAWATRTSSPSRRCSTSSATSRRSREWLGRRRQPLLQGHPRPARRRVHLDLQRRRVRAADQRRLRQRHRLHARARPARGSGPLSIDARLHLAAGAGQLERPARDRDPRRGRRGSAARARSRSTGTSATR